MARAGGCGVSMLPVVNVPSKSALSGYYRPRPLPVINYDHRASVFPRRCACYGKFSPLLFPVISFPDNRPALQVSRGELEAERISIPGQPTNELSRITLYTPPRIVRWMLAIFEPVLPRRRLEESLGEWRE